MAFTHVEIEERTTRTLTYLFAILGCLYVASLVALVWVGRAFLGFAGPLSWPHVFVLILIGLAIATIHWMLSTSQLMDRVLGTILARPLDPGDTYHERFKNIVEEVSIAVGGRYRIQPYVMSTTAMNACAVAEFGGRAAIVVTEGLLARLTRAQLESVIGHEAAHIAMGDSLSNSVFCGLFALQEESLKGLTGLFQDDDRIELFRGRAGLFLIVAMVILWATTNIKRLCALCISRKQEYRADAVAVRLTRNPLSLAEALESIARRWRGVGAQGESLSTIFIMDTGVETRSEDEGFFADWFSTHPPTHNRVAALLGMAHIRHEDFERAVTEQLKRPLPRRLIDVDAVSESATPTTWFVWQQDEWQGPLNLEQVMQLNALTPETWVRRSTDGAAKPAHQDAQLLERLRSRYAASDIAPQVSLGECPRCHLSLTRVLYEGVPLSECPACHGCYVTPSQLNRIFVRKEYAFPESIQRLAKAIPAINGTERLAKRFALLPSNRMLDRRCSACGAAVARKFYTMAYLVEVEQCLSCGFTWLDRDERELLQYLYEQSGDS